MAKRNKRPGQSARATAKSAQAGQAGAAGQAAKAAAKRRGHGQARRSGLFAGLKPNAANFAPLTPISFLPRTAAIHPGPRRGRARRRCASPTASSTSARGGSPRRWRGTACARATPCRRCCRTCRRCWRRITACRCSARCSTPSTRGSMPTTVAYILEHGEAKVLITDREYAAQVGPALAQLKKPPLVIDVDDPLYTGPGERLGKIEYEDFIAERRSGLRVARRSTDEIERDRAQLHLGHHRQSEGRGLSPPRHVPRSRSATSWRGRCRRSRCICGRCRCSTATAGASRGR